MQISTSANCMTSFFETPIEYLKGVGPQRAALLQKELNIFTFGDLIQHYPFRYDDRTKFYTISELNESMPHVQIKGKIVRTDFVGEGSLYFLTVLLFSCLMIDVL